MRAPEAVYAGAVFPGFEEGATIMGRLDYDAEKVTVKHERSQERIGKKVKAGHAVLPADKYSMFCLRIEENRSIEDIKYNKYYSNLLQF